MRSEKTFPGRHGDGVGRSRAMPQEEGGGAEGSRAVWVVCASSHRKEAGLGEGHMEADPLATKEILMTFGSTQDFRGNFCKMVVRNTI